MRTVGIIGMGHVGATVAYTLFTHSMVDELILIDKNEAKVNAEYNDLHDTLARNDSYVNVRKQDWDGLEDADIIITAFGDIAASVKTGDRFGEFELNAEMPKKLVQILKNQAFTAF